MPPSYSADVHDPGASIAARTGALPAGARAAFTADDLAREVGRRLAAIGSTVRVEVDHPPRARTHLVLRSPASGSASPAWEEVVRLDALSSDLPSAAAELMEAIETRRWQPAGGATLRLARSSVWCDPL